MPFQPEVSDDLLLIWRKRIFFSIFLTSLIAAFIPFIINTKIAVSSGQILNVAIYIAAYLIAVFVTFFAVIPFNVRAWAGLLLFYLIGVFALTTAGPEASGRMWLFTFAVLTSLLLGLRAGIIALALNAITMALWIWGWSESIFPWSGATQYPTSRILATGFSFLFMNAVVTISLGIFVTVLKNQFGREQGLSRDLRQSNENLLLENEERKKAEADLRKSEQKYRLLADNLNDVIWMMDLADLRFTYLSPSVERMTGFTPEEAMRRPLDEMLTPESFFRVRRILAEELAADQERDKDRPLTEVLEQYRKDGSTLWMEVTATFVRDAQNRPISVLGIGRDVTERKRHEQELSRSEERYRRLIETTPTAVITVTQDLLIEFANPAALKLFDASDPGELIGRPYLDMVHPEDRAGSMNRIALLLESGATQVPSRQHRYLTVKGEEIGVESVGAIFEHRGRKVFQAMIQDITERNRALAALKESEQRFRELARMLPETIFETDLNARLTYVNDAATQAFGYPPGSLPPGMSGLELIAPEDRARAAENLKAKLEGQERGGTEYRGLRKDGSVFPMIVHSTPIFKDGRVAGLRGLVIDISDLKKAEEEKERLEEHLRQAQKMQALGTLAGGIAHDFNNLLAAIIGHSELALVKAGEGVPNSQSIETVIKAGNRAKDLVTQILTFSRKLESNLKPVDLNRLVIQTGKMLERTIPKMIDIEHRLADDLWLVNADATQVSQVLMNLGTNARDAMPDGGRLVIETVNLTLDEKEPRLPPGASPGDYVRLRVSDTGRGMSQETLDHIFDPFFTDKEVGQGTGLGLSMVYGIVKSHGGHITCRSEVGRGTTFEVYLPAVPAAEESDSGEEVPETGIQGGSETILLVDDEEGLRELGRQILTRKGYRVLLAATGEEALEVYEAEGSRVDLIVLDINMPGMGGYKCLQEILLHDPQAKVIISTGYSGRGQLKRDLATKVAGFVPKPFSSREMLEAVRRVLDGGRD